MTHKEMTPFDETQYQIWCLDTALGDLERSVMSTEGLRAARLQAADLSEIQDRLARVVELANQKQAAE